MSLSRAAEPIPGENAQGLLGLCVALSLYNDHLL